MKGTNETQKFLRMILTNWNNIISFLFGNMRINMYICLNVRHVNLKIEDIELLELLVKTSTNNTIF